MKTRFPFSLDRTARMALLVWGGLLLPVSAAVLDWSSVTYPSGSLSQTYNNVDGTTVDINFDFPATPTTGIPGGSPNPSTGGFADSSPRIATEQTTDDGLYLFLEFGAQNPNGYVTLNVDFSEAVTDVSLTVFDIDFAANDFQDLVTIRGLTEAGTLVAPTTLGADAPFNRQAQGGFFDFDFLGTIFRPGIFSPVDPTVVDSSIIGVQGSPGLDNATGNWDFGSQELVGLVFVYTNGNGAPGDPMGQAVTLGNINFTPVVPEAETYWAGAALLLLMAGWEIKSRRFRRRKG